MPDRLWELLAGISREKPVPQGPPTHLVVGLGNPGAQYEGTRHNAGFYALDRVAEDAGCQVKTARFRALTGDAAIGGCHVLLMKPQTLMNLSGESVGAAANFYRIPPEHIIVLCDDIHFAPGTFRIRLHGSHGGHNGLKNIEAHLSSDRYVRIKIGVGDKPTPEYDLADWVLGKFPPDDRKKLDGIRPSVSDAVTLILEGKAEEAMARYSH